MSALDYAAAPYGPTAPATNMVAVSAPASDTAQVGRAFMVLTAGTVSVTTEDGDDVTFDATAGMVVTCAITDILAATTSDLLIYTR